jgi:predicted metal-dependent hydrolase
MIAAGERSEIRFGQTSIAYGIRRSSRRATVAIAIDPRDGVVLTAPAGTPIARLDRLVHAKARWIIEKLRRRSDLPPPLPVRELVSVRHG